MIMDNFNLKMIHAILGIVNLICIGINLAYGQYGIMSINIAAALSCGFCFFFID